MENLMIVATVAVVFGTIYKLFELFVGRKERLMLIDKLSENSLTDGKFKGLNMSSSYSALRFGCLLLGLGFGILMGYIIVCNSLPDYFMNDVNIRVRETVSVIYGASTLLGGGIGMLAAFIIEVFISKKIK